MFGWKKCIKLLVVSFDFRRTVQVFDKAGKQDLHTGPCGSGQCGVQGVRGRVLRSGRHPQRGGLGDAGRKREKGGGGVTDREGDREREHSNSKSNWKVLFYKDCSLGSVKILTTSP